MAVVVCKKCGAKTSDEFSYCTNCNAPITRAQEKSERSDKNRTPHHGLIEWMSTPLEDDSRNSKARKESCPNCGGRIVPGAKFCPTCGQALKINVGNVLNSTFRIIRKAPLIILPMFVELLLSSLLGLWIITYVEQVSSTATTSLLYATLWNVLPRLLTIVAIGFLVRPLVVGMYPSMVKNAMHGKAIDITQALRKAVSKYLSILISNVLVATLVSLGFLLLVIPGLIVSTWYYYTDSAIILEDHGALGGMSASKAFARNKKWKTFVILLIPGTITIVGGSILRGAPILTANSLAIFFAINLIFGLIAGVFAAVMSSYTYLSYAMRKTS